MKLELAITTFQRNAKSKDDKRCAKRLRETDCGRKMGGTDVILSLLQVMLGRNDGAARREIHGKGKE